MREIPRGPLIPYHQISYCLIHHSPTTIPPGRHSRESRNPEASVTNRAHHLRRAGTPQTVIPAEAGIQTLVAPPPPALPRPIPQSTHYPADERTCRLTDSTPAIRVYRSRIPSNTGFPASGPSACLGLGT